MSNIRWNVNDDLGAAFAAQTIAANGTTAFDFGTPNDINLAATPFKPGDRVLIAISAVRAGGTTSTLNFTVQDADDNDGSFGTPATATIDGTLPSFAADSGAVAKSGIVAVQVKPGRPWIRVNAVHGDGGTDSFQCHAFVIGVPRAL